MTLAPLSGSSGAAANTWGRPARTEMATPFPRVTIAPYQLFSTGAWFNGSVYIGADPGPIRQFIYAGGQLTPGTVSPQTSSEYQSGIMGTTPFVSSNGGTNGIVWALDHGAPLQDSKNPTPSSAVLHAYDATDLSKELYNSGMTNCRYGRIRNQVHLADCG